MVRIAALNGAQRSLAAARICLGVATLCLPTPSRAGCADPERLVRDAEAATELLELTDAERELSRAEHAFGCAPLVPTSVFARYLLARAAHATYRDLPADLYFSSAAALTPGAPVGPYAEDVRDAWARAAPPRGAAVLTLRRLRPTDAVAIDGEVRPPGAESFDLGAGLHLVQVGALPRAARYARIVDVPAGAPTVLAIPAAPFTPTAELATGAALVGLSGLSLGVGWLARDEFLGAPSHTAAAPWLDANHAALVSSAVFASVGGPLIVHGLARGSR